MNFKKIFAVITAVLIISSVFSGCRKTNDNNNVSSGVSSDVTTNYSNVEIVENESKVESVVETTSDNESSLPVQNNNNTSSTESTVSDEESNTNLNPDGVKILGSGTSTDPYFDTPNADTHTVKTLSIPAGKSVFYNIYRVGGRILTINSANAYVVCDGTKHTAKNGKVSFKVVDALASDAVSFEIGNTGSAAANFSITFTDLEGSMDNPTIVKNVDQKINLSLEKDNERGYFYIYKSTQKGILKLYILTGTDNGSLVATNRRTSAQRSTEATDEIKSDDAGSYIELEVENGDEIIINIAAKPKRGKYPAANIEWLMKY